MQILNISVRNRPVGDLTSLTYRPYIPDSVGSQFYVGESSLKEMFLYYTTGTEVIPEMYVQDCTLRDVYNYYTVPTENVHTVFTCEDVLLKDKMNYHDTGRERLDARLNIADATLVVKAEVTLEPHNITTTVDVSGATMSTILHRDTFVEKPLGVFTVSVGYINNPVLPYNLPTDEFGSTITVADAILEEL